MFKWFGMGLPDNISNKTHQYYMFVAGWGVL